MTDNADLEQLGRENLFKTSGLDEETHSVITLQPGVVYVSLAPGDDTKDDEGSTSFAVSIISSVKAEPNETLVVIAYGFLELMANEPDLIMDAGYAFMHRQAALEEKLEEQKEETPNG